MITPAHGELAAEISHCGALPDFVVKERFVFAQHGKNTVHD
jgi:hypothetical protein